jgi:hypothetical protein
VAEPSVKITIQDEALRALLGDLGTLARASVTVGYHEPTPVDDTGLDVPTLAAIQEYGTADIPARPFMRNGLRSAEPLLEYVASEALGKVALGESSPTRAMVAVGDAAAGRLVEQLETSKTWAQPNAPSTIRKKGYDFPLYAGKGRLQDEMKYAVLDRDKQLLLEKPSG